MATAKTNGSNYSVPPNTKNSGAANNSGATTRAGSSTNLSNVGVSRYNTDVFASTVIDNNWADKAVSGGTFAYNNVKPVAQRSSTTIAGLSSSVLKNGANVPSQIRSIHKLEVLRTRRLTTAIRANKYNRYTNTWDAGYPVVAVDSLATDTAATPTRSAPGQLTYKIGNPIPVSDNDYKPKTDG